MQFLSSLSSAVLSASSAALSGGNGVPGLPAFTLGDKVTSFEGKSLWSLYHGVKKDDSSAVSVFGFDLAGPSSSYSTGSRDRRALLLFARNALKKLRTLRHPNILRLLDGSETDTAVWIVTEPVRSLATALNEPGGVSEESKVYGLLHLATALSFLNKDGSSIHGNVRHEAIWITQGGDWKLAGMDVCTRKDEEDGIIYSHGGMLQDSKTYASPEVRKGGWHALKEYDASSLDSYQLHLLLYTLFNGPLPIAFSQSSDAPPALPNARGSIPASMFTAWRRLGNPNPRPRLKTDAFVDLGNGAESTGGGWWPSNRLVKLSLALEGFSLASESERSGLIRALKELQGQKSERSIPEDFLKYKVLPSLVRAFEFGGGGPALLPLILALAAPLAPEEYSTSIIQPLIRMFATPDRAMRMALLEGLDKFADKLTNKEVTDRIWPHLLTGFSDIVPVIREATVKSILLIAPKLTDRILNNELLRLLAKTQTDPEAGIRTNTCILLGRLSVHLQPMTNRKVLVPAFARALRDPFVHARIAGLMALMATADCYEKEDLAGKVIPAMSICLVDGEKAVRDQAYRAIDMFIKKCEALSVNMPVTQIVDNGPQNGALQQVTNPNLPGVAVNAAGAGVALAGWAFASVTKKLSAAELEAPINRANSTPPVLVGGQAAPRGPHQIAVPAPPNNRTFSEGGGRSSPSLSLPGGFDLDDGAGTDDWGGDLMDVNNDDSDWNGFETGQAPEPRIDPLAMRLSSTKAKPLRKAPLKLGGVKSSALRIPMDLDAGDNWDIEGAIAPKPKPIIKKAPISSPAAIPIAPRPVIAVTPRKPPPTIVVRAAVPISQPVVAISTPQPAPVQAPQAVTPQVALVEPLIETEVEAEPAPKLVMPSAPVSKEDKAAKMAQMREERRQRMAKAKEGK